MTPRPPTSTSTDTLLPYTTLFRSGSSHRQHGTLHVVVRWRKIQRRSRTDPFRTQRARARRPHQQYDDDPSNPSAWPFFRGGEWPHRQLSNRNSTRLHSSHECASSFSHYVCIQKNAKANGSHN